MSKGCEKCGAVNSADARYCRSCGTNLATEPELPAAPTRGVPCRRCAHLNQAGTRYCANCGADQDLANGVTHLTVRTRPPLMHFVLAGIVGLAVLGAVGVWLGLNRAPAGPTFDSAPPPSVSGAGLAHGSSGAASAVANGVAALPAGALPAGPGAAQAHVAEPARTDAPVPETSAGILSPPANAASSPAVRVDVAAAPASTPAALGVASTRPAAATAASAPRSRPDDPIAREARARALRDQRTQRAQATASQAAFDLARAKAQDDIRARGSTPPPAGALATRDAVRPAASPARSVQETCNSQNALMRSICEARECTRREHASESACLRVKAAEERHRQLQEGGE